jgi:hypothetical protein
MLPMFIPVQGLTLAYAANVLQQARYHVTTAAAAAIAGVPGGIT